MKKTLIFIVVSIALSSLISFEKSADIKNQETEAYLTLKAYSQDANAQETEAPKVQTPFIPKPTLLPGPTVERQKQEGGARSLLVDTILPFFAIGFIGIIGGISVVFLVIGGVRLATNYGNDEQIQKGKDQIKWALAGLVLSILSYTIVRILTNIRFSE